MAGRSSRVGRGVFPADWASQFNDTNELGAELFGGLWLEATIAVTDSFRGYGFSEQLERDYRLRLAVAHGLYRVLRAAMTSPESLKRARQKLKDDAMVQRITEVLSNADG